MKDLLKYTGITLSLLAAVMLVSCSGEPQDGTGTTPPSEKPAYAWKTIAANAQTVLEQQFWRGEPHNYYWIDNTHQDASFNHYWQTAHAMETLMDAYERSGDVFYKNRVGVVLARIKQSTGGKYLNEFYDDMAWMGMACLRAYDLFEEQEYMDAAETLLADVKLGWQEPNGGMLWNKHSADADKRNACTHWTVSCFASKMFLHSNNNEDLRFAIKVYDWAVANLYDAITGGTFDATDSKNVYLTYNQGVLIGSSTVLYGITRDVNYLDRAVKCADFSINNDKFGKDGIWRDEGASGTLNKNNGIFKGILVHYFIELIRCGDLAAPRRMAYVRYLESMAATLNDATKDTYLFSGDWRRSANAGETIYLGCQLSGTILMESLALFSEEYGSLLRYSVEE